MAQIKNRLNKLKKGGGSLTEQYVFLMDHFGWTLEDVKKLPITAIPVILKELNKIYKKKKGSGGRKGKKYGL